MIEKTAMTEPKVCFCESGTYLCWASEGGVVKVGRLDLGAENEWARVGGDVGLTSNRDTVAIGCGGGRVRVDFQGPDGLATTRICADGAWIDPGRDAPPLDPGRDAGDPPLDPGRDAPPADPGAADAPPVSSICAGATIESGMAAAAGGYSGSGTGRPETIRNDPGKTRGNLPIQSF